MKNIVGFTMVLALSACQSANTNVQANHLPFQGGTIAKPSEDAGLQSVRSGREAFYAKVRSGRIPGNYKSIVDKAIAQSLRDPDSRKIRFTKNINGGGVCGEVNAKNAYGGYTGSKRFLALFDSRQILFRLYIDKEQNSDTSTEGIYTPIMSVDCLL